MIEALQLILAIVGGILPFAFVVWVFMAIFGKAGFNKWWGVSAALLFTIPVLLIALAVMRWPVRKEIIIHRAGGENLVAQDVDELQAVALDHYNNGDLADAELVFRYLADKWPGTPTGDEARKMLELIAREKYFPPVPPPLP